MFLQNIPRLAASARSSPKKGPKWIASLALPSRFALGGPTSLSRGRAMGFCLHDECHFITRLKNLNWIMTEKEHRDLEIRPALVVEAASAWSATPHDRARSESTMERRSTRQNHTNGSTMQSRSPAARVMVAMQRGVGWAQHQRRGHMRSGGQIYGPHRTRPFLSLAVKPTRPQCSITQRPTSPSLANQRPKECGHHNGWQSLLALG
jgi:hypothetical protein